MINRREFLRRWFLYAVGGAVLASCAPRETPVLPTPLPSRPAVPTPPPPATLTSVPTPPPPSLTAPSATATPVNTRVPPSPTPDQAYLAVVRGTDPARLTRAAVDALGGMPRFVKSGDDVIIKPNICSASYGPEYASTTNPTVVATLVTLCLAAGAARVRVMDLPFSGTAVEAYKISGIREAVEQAGGQMEIMNMAKYVNATFPSTARNIKTWQVYQDVLKANVIINVPIAKTHSVTALSLGMKNLMGVVLKRAEIHWSIDQRIADLSTLIKPALNIVDGVRVLTRNGPVSGNLADVMQANTLLASHDIVAVDGYAAQLFFSKKPEQIGYIRLAQQMGLGSYDFANLKIRELSV